MKICLDAGHYGKYNRSKVVPEYYESEMNWKLHNYLAEELKQNLVHILNPGSSRQAKKSAGVYLMEHIRCPGVLIECGFLSNPEEAGKLAKLLFRPTGALNPEIVGRPAVELAEKAGFSVPAGTNRFSLWPLVSTAEVSVQ